MRMECAPSCVMCTHTDAPSICYSSIHIKSHKCYEIEITYCRCRRQGTKFSLRVKTRRRWREMQIFEKFWGIRKEFNREEGKWQNMQREREKWKWGIFGQTINFMLSSLFFYKKILVEILSSSIWPFVVELRKFSANKNKFYAFLVFTSHPPHECMTLSSHTFYVKMLHKMHANKHEQNKQKTNRMMTKIRFEGYLGIELVNVVMQYNGVS